MKHRSFPGMVSAMSCGALLFLCVAGHLPAAELRATAERDFLYVATPGIRDYLEYGGHGVLVFDIDQGHKFLKRIPSAGADENKKPLHVKGVAACAKTHPPLLAATRTLLCFHPVAGKLLLEKPY